LGKRLWKWNRKAVVLVAEGKAAAKVVEEEQGGVVEAVFVVEGEAGGGAPAVELGAVEEAGAAAVESESVSLRPSEGTGLP
jgi:hypothetical protein